MFLLYLVRGTSHRTDLVSCLLARPRLVAYMDLDLAEVEARWCVMQQRRTAPLPRDFWVTAAKWGIYEPGLAPACELDQAVRLAELAADRRTP